MRFSRAFLSSKNVPWSSGRNFEDLGPRGSQPWVPPWVRVDGTLGPWFPWIATTGRFGGNRRCFFGKTALVKGISFFVYPKVGGGFWGRWFRGPERFKEMLGRVHDPSPHLGAGCLRIFHSEWIRGIWHHGNSRYPPQSYPPPRNEPLIRPY